MKVIVEALAIEHYKFRVRVVADGRVVEEAIAFPRNVVTKRNRMADYWASRPDVSSVMASPIPWHPTLY